MKYYLTITACGVLAAAATCAGLPFSVVYSLIIAAALVAAIGIIRN